MFFYFSQLLLFFLCCVLRVYDQREELCCHPDHFSPQFCSSVPSPQSSLPSHTCLRSTQPSRLHSIVPAGHFSPGRGSDGGLSSSVIIALSTTAILIAQLPFIIMCYFEGLTRQRTIQKLQLVYCHVSSSPLRAPGVKTDLESGGNTAQKDGGLLPAADAGGLGAPYYGLRGPLVQNGGPQRCGAQTWVTYWYVTNTLFIGLLLDKIAKLINLNVLYSGTSDRTSDNFIFV